MYWTSLCCGNHILLQKLCRASFFPNYKKWKFWYFTGLTVHAFVHIHDIIVQWDIHNNYIAHQVDKITNFLLSYLEWRADFFSFKIWLGDLAKEMKSTLRKLLVDCLRDQQSSSGGVGVDPTMYPSQVHTHPLLNPWILIMATEKLMKELQWCKQLCETWDIYPSSVQSQTWNVHQAYIRCTPCKIKVDMVTAWNKSVSTWCMFHFWTLL